MKNLKVIFLAVITMYSLVSCSSDDDNQTNEELIIGTWKWTAFSEDGVAETLTECELLTTITFTTTTYSYTGYYSTSGTAPCTAYEDENTYSISDNTIVMTEDGDIVYNEEIVTLNATTLTIRYEESDGDDTYVYLETYTRQ